MQHHAAQGTYSLPGEKWTRGRQLGDKCKIMRPKATKAHWQTYTQKLKPWDTSKITRPRYATVSKELEPHKGKHVSGKKHGLILKIRILVPLEPLRTPFGESTPILTMLREINIHEVPRFWPHNPSMKSFKLQLPGRAIHGALWKRWALGAGLEELCGRMHRGGGPATIFALLFFGPLWWWENRLYGGFLKKGYP